MHQEMYSLQHENGSQDTIRVTLPDTSPAFAGGTDTVILLAHVRRWKSDKRFFKALGKVFSISDITSTIDKDAHLLTSNTKVCFEAV